MNTPSLPGWLQVVLVWLVGVVGWLLLRPYRRITQLGGKDSATAIASAGSWHRRFFRDMREAARLEVAEGGGTREPTFGKGRTVYVDQSNLRPEARLEDPAQAAANRAQLGSAPAEAERTEAPAPRPDGSEPVRAEIPARGGAPAHRAAPGPARPSRPATWTEPDVAERPASYAIYRPETGDTTREPAPPRVRSETR
jgi:hypothetical protein